MELHVQPVVRLSFFCEIYIIKWDRAHSQRGLRALLYSGNSDIEG